LGIFSSSNDKITTLFVNLYCIGIVLLFFVNCKLIIHVCW